MSKNEYKPTIMDVVVDVIQCHGIEDISVIPDSLINMVCATEKIEPLENFLEYGMCSLSEFSDDLYPSMCSRQVGWIFSDDPR